jgi:hypothetical protein
MNPNEQHDALVSVDAKFYNALLAFWLRIQDRVFDDPDLQEDAYEAGLLRAEVYDSEKHADILTEAPFEDGDTIYLYNFTKLMKEPHGRGGDGE